MTSFFTTNWRKHSVLIAGAATLALGLAACGSNAPVTSSRPTATFAYPAAVTNNAIFGLGAPEAQADDVYGFQYLLYPPLYWFGNNGKPLINYSESMAYPPRFSDGNRRVTISLKPYRWSNGVPLSSRDIEFWMNILMANKLKWSYYVPGSFPDNLSNISYPNASTVIFTFNKTYNPTWLLYNELSQVMVYPQQVWDKTSVASPVGNYDMTHAGAVKVANFLISQSNDLTTYTTNPLWKVVIGPWKLQAYSPGTGYTAFTANKNFSGPAKPKLSKFVELPFTSDTAEFDALMNGTVDYGYVPPQDLAQVPTLRSKGYTINAWPEFAVSYMIPNFTNPTTGPILKQLYIRQALQSLINQQEYVKDFWHGYAVPTYGPVPTVPANPWASTYEIHNPYPFSVATAEHLLSEHGWKDDPSGDAICERPGSSTDECGAGVAKGAALNFKLAYENGNVPITDEVEAMQSTMSRAGIQLTLSSASFNDVIANAIPCDPSTGTGCSWDLIFYGGGWVYGPDYYPTGGEIFSCGAGSNFGSYCSSHADSLIAATHSQSGVAAMDAYENYLAQQLPVFWLPNNDSQISAIKSGLQGTLPQDSLGMIYPQKWYWTS